MRESLAHRALACQGSGRPVDRRLRTRSRSQTRSRSWSGLVVLDQVCDHPMRRPLRAALRSLLTFFMVAPLLRSLAGSGREPLRRSSDGRFINWCSINRRLATCAASNHPVVLACVVGGTLWFERRLVGTTLIPLFALLLRRPFASFGLGALLLGAHSSFTRVPVGYATTLRIARTTPHTRTHALTPSLGCSGGSLVLEPPAHPPARPVGFERILGAQRWLRAFECRPHTCPGAEGAARVTLLRVRPALPSASDWAVQPVGHPRWGAVFQLCLWAL